MRNKTIHPPRLTIAALIVALSAFLYIYIYQVEPFPSPWNDFALKLELVVAAFLAAIIATHTWSRFKIDDAPRLVWMNFALGLWCWAVAELIWVIIFSVYGDVPIISLADIFWLVGLVPFTVAFVVQYRLIYSPPAWKETLSVWAVILSVILASLLGTKLLHGITPAWKLFWVEALLQVFYAVTDLAMMLAALSLAFTFGRGLWGRAWLGLLAFTLSDSLFSWITSSGLYAISVERGNLLSLVVDCLYMLAYMLVALACYSQYLLVTHGPALMPSSPSSNTY